MAIRIEKEFAVSGDKTAVPTDSTSTELSFDQGWSSAYELAQGTAGARDISRPQHNYLWSVISGNIKQWQEQGFPEYFSGIDYEAGAVVKYTDDENYICHTPQAAGTLPTDHSAFINLKFYGAYAYTVSQLANGSASAVGFIYEGQTVDSYDYLIYPGDGRIYARGSVTGTTTGPFNPVDGTATGLSAALVQVNGVKKSELDSLDNEVDLYKKSTSITMTDATYTLSASENLYGRIVISGTLTAGQELIISDDERFLTVKNNTGYAIKVKTASGTGVHVEVGEQFSLRVESGNVVSSGYSNKIIVLGESTYTGSYNYPLSLVESNFSRILFFPVNSGNDFHYQPMIVDSILIESDPAAWSVSSNPASSEDTVITATSATEFSVTGSTVYVLGACVAYLKDGVTY